MGTGAGAAPLRGREDQAWLPCPAEEGEGEIPLLGAGCSTSRLVLLLLPED